jgi:ABC-2 type transport system ATP-binding protein
MIKAENVKKKFGNFEALKGLSLNAEKGSVYGLIGPNGAGKTTFIKCLMGIYRTNSGTILVDNEPVYKNIILKQRVVYISDELYFNPTYSVLDTAKLYSDIYKNWDWDMYKKLSEIFKIDEKRKCIKLSKGMQKQVAFWLGICTKPDLMVLDEPVDGLDPVMRRNTWSILLQEVAEREMTVLVSSHNLRELEDVCDHVGIMFDGNVVIEKSLDDVKGEIHKLQLAFKGGITEELCEKLQLLHKSTIGSLDTLIVKGDEEHIREIVNKYEPIIFDILPLTLEEVFIYELGGMGYEFKNIIV